MYLRGLSLIHWCKGKKKIREKQIKITKKLTHEKFGKLTDFYILIQYKQGCPWRRSG